MTTTSDAEKRKEAAYGLAIIALIPLRLWTLGFVASKLYSWFVRSLWDRLPEIGVAHWLGIWLFLVLFMPLPNKRANEESFERTMSGIIGAWVSLLIGWILL
jgi:hypothetical protein